jgi:high-affinity iron transporter
MCRLLAILTLFVTLSLSVTAHAASLGDDGSSWDAWTDAVDRAMVDGYAAEDEVKVDLPAPPTVLTNSDARAVLAIPVNSSSDSCSAAGVLRARAQQALTIEMAATVRAGDVERARTWRARLLKPRGSSSTEGALILQTLSSRPQQRAEAARTLAREAIAWQTTRARQLVDDGIRSARHTVPMPGRMCERFAEAVALADMPPALRAIAELPADGPSSPAALLTEVEAMIKKPWGEVATAADPIRRTIESTLPSVLSADEKARRERLVLKLVALIPREYAAGVRDGEVSVPLEYREAVTFTAQARQMAGELAPLWLKSSEKGRDLTAAVATLDKTLAAADAIIARKGPSSELDATMGDARKVLEGPLGVSLRRAGSTTEIVEEVLLETRSLLNASLAAAHSGNWAQAEQMRVEAYTTFDPDLEARLLPRDPQLAMDIERLLLDGIDHPGIKVLLDRRERGPDLDAAYARVTDAMEKAGAMLKTGVDPTAAALNAGSIVLREGLEGLLVIVAIFAGLRGAGNAQRRRLFWVGILASVAATALTWLLSRTLITSLHAYAEIIAAITGLLAIVILLLITNWLFHQVYWKQWVTTLKAQAQEGESVWQLVTVGFLVGYREGFETVLFLQSLMLDAGGQPVSIGVIVGCSILILLGIAALKVGLKLPYFKILLVTALLIGVVLITFVGGTVRAMQTVGWLPVHRLMPGSWPNWVGTWLGLYNTWQSVGAQILTSVIVLGTWRVARHNARAKGARRRAERSQENRAVAAVA